MVGVESLLQIGVGRAEERWPPMTRAVYYEVFGSAKELQVGDIEPMPLGPDCVRVAVAGAGINPVDYKIREGYVAGAIATVFPVVPGWDLAGTITELGPAVTEFEVGDPIYGYARMDIVKYGTLAAEVVVPVRLVAAAPTRIDLRTAAGVPLVGLTAYQLLQRLNIKSDDTVLVHNAAGGVGQFAVQLARLAGAKVIGTSSPDNHEHLASLGIEPVRYGPTLVDEVRALAPKGVDVVADLIGGGALEQSDPLLRAGARVGSIADGAGAKARSGAYVFVRPSPNDLALLADLIDDGKLQVDIAAKYPLEEAVAAYELLESGHVRGKIVITP